MMQINEFILFHFSFILEMMKAEDVRKRNPLKLQNHDVRSFERVGLCVIASQHRGTDAPEAERIRRNLNIGKIGTACIGLHVLIFQS